MKTALRLPKKLRQKIRDTAIRRAQTRILLAGRRVEDFAEHELEFVVAEEEEKIYGNLKEKGLLALAAALGLGWWL